MQLSILSGVYTTNETMFRQSPPKNMSPVAMDSGIAAGFLRNADGLERFTPDDTPGLGRGGILWRGECYRVMGNMLCKIREDGTIQEIGFVGDNGAKVTLDYSFDQLIIVSARDLYYWDGSALTQLTDPDLGDSIDAVWLDGYTVSTDGEFIVHTELNDPFSVDPFKYGSSEIDPDPIIGLIEVRNELYALNRFTIEVFDNVGGDGFAFQRNEGATIPKGIVTTHAKAILGDSFAFVGSGKNETCGVYVASNGRAVKISTREIDQVLSTHTDAQLQGMVCESRTNEGNEEFLVHLPEITYVYDLTSSVLFKTPVWYSLHSDNLASGSYRAINFTLCYGKWLCDDKISPFVGQLTKASTKQYGELVGWEFNTQLLYNKSQGALVHKLELVGINGRVPAGIDPRIFCSFTDDGLMWSDERVVRGGERGIYNLRPAFMQCGMFKNYRSYRFRGADDAFYAIATLDAAMEPLNA